MMPGTAGPRRSGWAVRGAGPATRGPSLPGCWQADVRHGWAEWQTMRPCTAASAGHAKEDGSSKTRGKNGSCQSLEEVVASGGRLR